MAGFLRLLFVFLLLVGVYAWRGGEGGARGLLSTLSFFGFGIVGTILAGIYSVCMMFNDLATDYIVKELPDKHFSH